MVLLRYNFQFMHVFSTMLLNLVFAILLSVLAKKGNISVNLNMTNDIDMN